MPSGTALVRDDDNVLTAYYPDGSSAVIPKCVGFDDEGNKLDAIVRALPSDYDGWLAYVAYNNTYDYGWPRLSSSPLSLFTRSFLHTARDSSPSLATGRAPTSPPPTRRCSTSGLVCRCGACVNQIVPLMPCSQNTDWVPLVCCRADFMMGSHLVISCGALGR